QLDTNLYVVAVAGDEALLQAQPVAANQAGPGQHHPGEHESPAQRHPLLLFRQTVVVATNRRFLLRAILPHLARRSRAPGLPAGGLRTKGCEIVRGMRRMWISASLRSASVWPPGARRF